MSLLFLACAPLLFACQDQGPGFLSGGAPVSPQMSKPQFRGYPDQDAERYVVTMNVLSNGGFEGTVAYRFRAMAPLDHIFLDRSAVATWKTSFFTSGGQPLHVVESDYSVMVPVGKTLKVGETFEFAAKFSGTAAPGLYRERNQHGDTFVFNDSFPASTRGWLPCEDSNSDRASFELTLTIPPGWDAVGSGAWQEVSLPEGDKSHGRRFVGKTISDIPPGLFAFTAGPYLRFPESGDPRLVDHYIFPQDRKKAEGALEFHAEWMEIMERTFGPYQYAKFTTVQIPTKWGGMEYPGNVWLSKRIFDYEGKGVSTMAHEFAHMWFGDAIGYAQWEDSWLSEGFASYFGPWLYEQAGGGGPLLDDLKSSRTRWRQATRARKLPILWNDYTKPRDFFGRVAANTYQKGAWVLHMLRQEVGDEAFFGGIATYYKTFAGQAVVSADFIAAMEAASGKDLTWFFEQWLERPGAPRLELEDQDGTLIVRQTQAGEPYRFKLRIAWQDKEGKAVDKVFAIDSAETSLELGKGSRAWQLDPQAELLFVE